MVPEVVIFYKVVSYCLQEVVTSSDPFYIVGEMGHYLVTHVYIPSKLLYKMGDFSFLDMSKKQWPILYNKLLYASLLLWHTELYKIGNYFLNI